MLSDCRITKKFIKLYFKSEKYVPLHKIYLISNKQSASSKYYKLINKLTIKLIKKRINSINTDILSFYEHHIWFNKMVDIFKKIFRDIPKINKLEHLVYRKFKKRIYKYNKDLVFEMTKSYIAKDTNNLQNYFEQLDLFYNINLKKDTEKEIVKNYIEMIKNEKFEIEDLKFLINNLNCNFFKIKNDLMTSICIFYNENKIIECLDNKDNLDFINLLFSENKNKLKIIIRNYIDINYINLIKNSKTDEEYVNSILKMYKDYIHFDLFIKSVFQEKFEEINIDTDRFLKILDKQILRRNENFHEMIGFLFNIIIDKEDYEFKLRKALCLRLINSSNIQVEDEEYFLKIFRKTASDIYFYKMNDVLEDYRKRIIFNNSEIMMIRKFQWVEFENKNIMIEELEEIKNKYENQIAKFERKKIVWMDYLSTVEVEIFNKNILISLIQYKILLDLENKWEDEPYKHNLRLLIDRGLIILKDEKYIINENFKCTNFLINDHLLKQKLAITTNNKNHIEKEILDSKIMFILKKNKILTLNELYRLSKKELINERLKLLQKKGFLEIVDQSIKYIP